MLIADGVGGKTVAEEVNLALTSTDLPAVVPFLAGKP